MTAAIIKHYVITLLSRYIKLAMARLEIILKVLT